MPIIEDNGDVHLAADTGKDGNGRFIVSTGGVERAGINADGTGTGLLSGSRPDVTAARPSGVAATDTAALQAAIDATPSGGSLVIPGAVDRTTPYLLNAALTVTKHIRIEGAVVAESWVTSASGGSLNHPSGLLGVVLKQVTAATDVIQLSGAAINVRLRNLGLTFDAAIKDTNTGSGINAYPTLVNGSGHDSGLIGFVIDNVSVLGCDGNHYALQLRNVLYGLVSHFHSFGGGGILVDCDSFVGNFGNCVFEDTYCEVVNSGTADAYRLQSRTARGSSSGHLNLCTFVRPQANITGAAATAATQKLWNSLGGSNLPSGIYLVAPDLESGSTNPVDFGGRNSGTQVANGGLINNPPAAGYDREGARYQSYTTGTTTFVVPTGVTELRVRVVGAGGGGGGGGTNAGAAANTGGGGGGAGMVSEAVVAVTAGSSLSAVVGAGGTSGTAGVTGGNAGGNGGVGGVSSFGTSLAKANGGGGGAGGPASGTGSSGGGKYAQTGQITTVGVPGVGGVSQSPNGNGSTPIPPGVVGGGAGGAATATNGGGAGGAQTGSFPAFAAIAGGSGGASGTATGVTGVTATTPGCGGGGGGGALTGGTGGAGGVGADGMVEIWW